MIHSQERRKLVYSRSLHSAMNRKKRGRLCKDYWQSLSAKPTANHGDLSAIHRWSLGDPFLFHDSSYLLTPLTHSHIHAFPHSIRHCLGTLQLKHSIRFCHSANYSYFCSRINYRFRKYF